MESVLSGAMPVEEQVEGRRASPSRDRFLFAGFLAGALLVAFIGGAVLTAANIFPGPLIAAAYKGGMALYAKLTRYDDVYASDLWFPQRTAASGVTIHDEARTRDGLTLYSSGHTAAAFLIDMDGRVLHTWRRAYSTVWNESAKVKDPQPDTHVYFRKAKLFDNGDLLAIYEGVGDTPYGYGMVKLDRDSNLLWSYLGHTHHDFDVGPDGRIYVLTHDISTTPLVLASGQTFDHLVPPRIDDYLVMLSPDGEELATIPLTDAVARSLYRSLLYTVSSFAVADPLHANAVQVITPEMAANFPYGKPGQVLLSFRELGAIGVLDPDTRELVWAAKGSWIGQHDPDILPNGNILMFDNKGAFARPEGASRVMEFDPKTMNIVWQYAGNAEHPFDSQIRAGQQRLADGNTLIVESNGGRMFEITASGEIVWEFVNPVRGGPNKDKVPIIASAERIDRASIDSGLLYPD